GVLPHFAIEVEDLPSVIDTLRAMGIDTFCAEQPNVLPELFGGLQNIFFRGPSGEMIELIEHFDMESSER
ncbi:MAG: VOC family protein, partial [Butyricicoccus sp.]